MFEAALREGRTTSVLDEEATGAIDVEGGGDDSFLRLVVGRDFLLKKGTLTGSAEDMSIVLIRLHLTEQTHAYPRRALFGFVVCRPYWYTQDADII